MYVRFSYQSQALMRSTDVHLILPWHDGYPDAKRPYPLLLFLPGYSACGEDITFLFPLRRFSMEYGIAIAIPDGENSFYTDHPERAANNGLFVGKELIGVLQRMFPALTKERTQTYIAGISMGGYGAAALGLHYSETFSKIAMMSPAIDLRMLTDSAFQSIEGAVPPQLFDSLIGGQTGYATPRHQPRLAVEEYIRQGRPLPPMYMCCGEQDALAGPSCQEFKAFLERKSIPLTYEAGPGGHDLRYWDDHLDAVFRFLKDES